jgi:putative pyrimidine permease RutG
MTQETYGASVSEAKQGAKGAVLYPEDTMDLGTYLLTGFQHVVAMFGSTVLAPILMGFDPNTCILYSGIATIIFFFIVDGEIPSYL